MSIVQWEEYSEHAPRLRRAGCVGKMEVRAFSHSVVRLSIGVFGTEVNISRIRLFDLYVNPATNRKPHPSYKRRPSTHTPCILPSSESKRIRHQTGHSIFLQPEFEILILFRQHQAQPGEHIFDSARITDLVPREK